MAWTAGLLLACVAIAARSRRLRSGCTEQDWNPCVDFEVLRQAGDTEAALGSDGPAGNAIRFKAIAQLLLAFNTVATGLGLTFCGQNVGARSALFVRGCSAHAVAAQQGIVETKQALFDATQGPLDRSSNLNLQHDHIHTTAEDHLSPAGMDAIRLCKEWISHHVIRLGLCPFAATPFAKEKIRYSVSDATSSEELLEDFFDEGLLLLDADPEDIATTMLIAPQYPEGIEAFHEMYEWLVELLESGDEPVLENRVQPAFFHPDWNFEELPDESPIHFEKRAPIPVINLLRRADLDAVVKKGLDRGIIINKEIAEHNAASLEAEGIERLSTIFRTRLTREAFPALAHAGPCPHHTQSSTSRDPGRLGLSVEFATNPGRTVLDMPLASGGSLQVTAHDTIAEDSVQPPWMVQDGRQEWRVLRFRPAEGTADLIQSVSKVCIAPPGSPGAIERQRGDCLALAYTKTHVAVTLAALQALGAPVLPGGSAQPLRILCIGLGGGSVPSFLTENLPHCEVDVAELEPAVVQAASQAMGFVENPRLRVSLQDGVSFAAQAVLENVDAEGAGVYDAVLVDAYDAAGNVPESFWRSSAGIARVLRKGLLKSHGLIATNFMPNSEADVAAALDVYSTALPHGSSGTSFSVQGEGHGNLIAVQTSTSLAEESLQEQLRRAARQVQATLACPFDLEQLAVRDLNIFPAASHPKRLGAISKVLAESKVQVDLQKA